MADAGDVRGAVERLRGAPTWERTDWGRELERDINTVLDALSALTADLEQAERERRAAYDMYQEEYTVVDRVWKALGITDYAGAHGKSVDEIVKALTADLEAAQRK